MKECIYFQDTILKSKDGKQKNQSNFTHRLRFSNTRNKFVSSKCGFSSKYSNTHFRAKIVNVYLRTLMWWSLTFKRLVARNEPRRSTLILVYNREMAYTSITPYVKYLMNSRFEKILFIVDSVLVL